MAQAMQLALLSLLGQALKSSGGSSAMRLCECPVPVMATTSHDVFCHTALDSL